ncbi:D-lactaldehyde dehydrogenase [Coprinopsis sp. MPI-PUGE-AT-0042]|nr:D-lactaldehyde dehydrogenase [Coprinopsis sp. MPI-PUGE-AT-0042]
MPTVSPSDKVLVTGANGYVALWIVKVLLERGNSVRAAVRSESKGRHLRELFKSYGDKLEIVAVPDMTKSGAWDEAVQGVQAIEHTATPVSVSNPNPKPEDYIEPAIKGTVGVLESALKYQNGIKRVVITSSLVAVASFADANGLNRTFADQDWNESSVKVVEEKGAEAGLLDIYSASKVLAEKAAWDFYNKHKTEVNWDLTVIAPPMVFGGMLGEASSPESLNASVSFFWHHIVSDAPKTREELSAPNVWIDVRDLAEAHVLALEKEKAGGERFVVGAGSFIWQELIDVANKLSLPGRKLLPGFPDLKRETGLNVSSSKAVSILGLTYRSKEDTIGHALEDFAKRGL